jgi:hypothetical protein
MILEIYSKHWTDHFTLILGIRLYVYTSYDSLGDTLMAEDHLGEVDEELNAKQH